MIYFPQVRNITHNVVKYFSASELSVTNFIEIYFPGSDISLNVGNTKPFVRNITNTVSYVLPWVRYITPTLAI